MSYADLLTTSKGRDVARSLVSTIINMQIGQNLSVDAISDVLQQRCGSFCSADDVLLYKVSYIDLHSSLSHELMLVQSGHRKHSESQIWTSSGKACKSTRVSPALPEGGSALVWFPIGRSRFRVQWATISNWLRGTCYHMCKCLGFGRTRLVVVERWAAAQ